MLTLEDKKKFILSFLNLYPKTGASLKQINDECKEREGVNIMDTRDQAVDLLASMKNVRRNVDGRYFSFSETSSHVKTFVNEQIQNRRDQSGPSNYQPNRPTYRPAVFNYAGRNNQIDSRSAPSHNFSAQKIGKRRMTVAHSAYSREPSPEAKKLRSMSPDQRSYASKRNHSPIRRPGGEGQRNRYGSPNPRDKRSRSPRGGRSVSPDRRSHNSSYKRSRSPRDKRSVSPRNRRPQTSSDKWLRNSQVTEPKSPKRRSSQVTHTSVRHDMRPIASYNDADLFDLEPPPQSCASPQQVKKPSRQQVEEAIPQQQGEKASHTHIETQESKIETQPVVKPKPKNYKFSVIGDGYIYYLLQDMSVLTSTNMMFCNHNQTIAEATKMIESEKEKLQSRKKKVLLSIGTTDLKNNQRLTQMKLEYTKLFLLCHGMNLKPLITTIHCFDTPELKAKADIFNDFLRDSFQNVVDMQEVMRFGLGEVMATMNKKHEEKPSKASLNVGISNQLIVTING